MRPMAASGPRSPRGYALAVTAGGGPNDPHPVERPSRTLGVSDRFSLNVDEVSLSVFFESDVGCKDDASPGPVASFGNVVQPPPGAAEPLQAAHQPAVSGVMAVDGVVVAARGDRLRGWLGIQRNAGGLGSRWRGFARFRRG